MIRSAYFLFIFAVAFFAGCKQKNPQIPSNKVTNENILENTAAFNRIMIDAENESINEFLSEANIPYERNDLGIYIYIEKDGSGDFIKKGQDVSLTYKVNLIDGTECYNSEDRGLKKFKVGTLSVEKGLEECIVLLKKESKAKMIIPSYLGHGIIGDFECITPRTPVLYEIEVIDVK